MKIILAASREKLRASRQAPLLVELFQEVEGEVLEEYGVSPFIYLVKRVGENRVFFYEVRTNLSQRETAILRIVLARISEELTPRSIEPLTFEKLVAVMEQLAAKGLAELGTGERVKELATLCAYEAIGLSRILALARDTFVTEFYLDSPRCPLYMDHYKYGRCESTIFLTERERSAIETHMDTFRGYSMDYSLPSLKNDLEVGGNRLRVSLDLEPLAVSTFSLDVRRLDVRRLSLRELVACNTISPEAAAFVLAWLGTGMNVTITGETGTGKTTLLNALDEALDPRLRRIYVEDAVETKDMLDRGYHQMKLRVDPFERSDQSPRTKGMEIIRILHRSPDIVILSELQSEEHSRAFFHSLSTGIRGLQTFHAANPEQAMRRWEDVYGIEKNSLLDLGLIIQMKRPDRIQSTRLVTRVCEVVGEDGEPRIRDIYLRDRELRLQRILPWERIELAGAECSKAEFQRRVEEILSRSIFT